MEDEAAPRKRSKSIDRGSSRDRVRRRRTRTRSRSRNVRRSRSRSVSPLRQGWSGGFRGGRRFNRRSPPFRGGGRGFNRDRFNNRRSRSTSRGRFDRRRYDEHDHRRSRSTSQSRQNDFSQQQQQQQQQQQHQQAAPIAYGNEAYGNYGVPQFPGSMAQFNTYDFQASYPPPAPNFSMNPAMNCPAPPGMTEWQSSQATMMSSEPEEEKLRREAAIAEEKKRQREGLKKQRDQYISRSEKMKRELKMLKEQKSGLLDGHGKRSPSPKTNGFIKENDKLQAQISSKLSEILNVIDMLNGIIGKDLEEERKSKKSDSDSSPERIKSKLLESMKGKKKEVEERKQKVNFIYYDPELHWCKPCQAFPKTAQDYLNHLHTKEHLDKLSNRTNEAPWRSSFQKLNEVPSHPDAPTKRAPIKGLQFFEPTTAWFCKLCEMFMGDPWCTSLHLKSAIHAERYAKFIEKEPKFEEKWLEARNKAFENFGCLDSIVEQHQKNSLTTPQDSNDKKLLDKKKKKKSKKDGKKKRKRGKKKKHSSSSSDSDDNSDSSSTSSDSKKNESNNESKNSIRVAMRNLLGKGAPGEGEKTGWTMVSLDPNKPPIPPPPAISQNASKETKKDEQLINQWSTVEPIISQEEKRLLENLKGRYKQNKAENEKLVPPPPPQVSTSSRRKSRDRSRSKERRNERNFRQRKSRSRSKNSPRRRSISRDRRKSNSRDRRRSNSRDRDRRRSPRYGRRYSSRSRSPCFIRPNIIFPTEPRLPPLREEKKQPTRSYVITKKEEPTISSSSSALANVSKKMPLIGRMPVFKKQLIVEKRSETPPKEKSEEKEINFSAESLEEKNRHEDWNDLMPDPMQFTAMMHSAAQPVQPVVSEEQSDAPPGLDPDNPNDTEFIPKPISDAPMMRKGPLPKDLQETLDILFDGDSQLKPVVMEPIIQEVPMPIALPVDSDGPQMIMADELSQLYGNYDIQPVPAPPVISKKSDKKSNDKNDSIEEESDEKIKNEDMDDLAMLGIDINDVGSGLW